MVVVVRPPGKLPLPGGPPEAHEHPGAEPGAQHGPAVAILREEPQLRQGGARPGAPGRDAQVSADLSPLLVPFEWCFPRTHLQSPLYRSSHSWDLNNVAVMILLLFIILLLLS